MRILLCLAAMVPLAFDDSPPGTKPAAPGLPELRMELLRRKDVDQKARFSLVESMNKAGQKPGHANLDQQLLGEMLAIDAANTTWMKEVIGKHGWPGKTLVGEDGASAAWLLIQHADRDREFQKTCLKLMEALPAGEIRGENIAYLQDRVLVGEGKPQRYGTQTTEVNGKFVPSAIEDEGTVDERRKKLGMPPLSEYLKQVEAMYRPKKPAS